MNKVVVVVGSITVVVVGGLFFCAGMFAGADLNNKNITVNPQEMATKLKDKVNGLLNKNNSTEIKVLDTKDNQKLIDDDLDALQSPLKSGILFERPSVHVTIDSLLNEVISSHNTTDQCLLDNIKTDQKENVVSNSTKKNLVFIGYFPVNIAEQISKLLMAKGYPAHIQISNMNKSEAFVFCGPFKRENRANVLVKWLQQHDFANAKIIKGALLKSEKIDEKLLISEIADLPTNTDNTKNNKQKINESKKLEVDSKIDVKNDSYEIDENNVNKEIIESKNNVEVSDQEKSPSASVDNDVNNLETDIQETNETTDVELEE